MESRLLNGYSGGMDIPADDPEHLLTFGNLRCRVGSIGASLRGLWQEDAGGSQTTVITGYTGKANKVGGQGDVLIPFPGRVRDGQYTWNGQTYQMPRNDKDGPNAIHGFLRGVPWQVVAQAPDAITFAADLDGSQEGYPFPLFAQVMYTLADDGLTCRFCVTNTGTEIAPVGAGFHPYFTVGTEQIDLARLHVPFRSALEFDEGLLPTGNLTPVAGTPLDFLAPRPIAFTRFNTCYADPVREQDGRVHIRLAAPEPGRALSVWMDDSFHYVVLYSGDPLPDTHRRGALAIEPMTCGSDAFNFPQWGLWSLAPGETRQGAWGVTPA